jgi:hypothetical protein
MKKILLIILLSFAISSNSYSQFLGKSVFKNNERLDLDKIIKLDITKYKISDVKKLFGEDYLTEKKERVEYYIFLTQNDSKYKLKLFERSNYLMLFVDLVEDDISKSKKSSFESCTELKNKYEKQFGKSYRYWKRVNYEFLKFQINQSNHQFEVFCQSLDNKIFSLYVANTNKKTSRIMTEVSKITCTFDKTRVDHIWLQGSNSDYLTIKNLDKKEIQNLFIDDYEKKIGRVMDYNYEIIGEYKTYNKDTVEVVEKKSNVSSITWTLNRMNGDIETFLQSSEAEVFNRVRNGEYKVRRYGNCQKFKNNVL